ncbi:MAG TPA: cupin domain-containing protein [Chloroflexota bacterium]|nr:cupin domain-containing protein [Chloroflexota bacterium]
MITHDRVEHQTIESPKTGERCYYNPVQKDWATILETSEETHGERALIEVELAPGGGTTPHYHKTYAEHFEVLQGSLAVTVNGLTRTLGPGEKAAVPKNTLHNFRNPTEEPTTFLVELRPGSSGFERALKVGYGLARDGMTSDKGVPKNLSYMALLMEWSDMRMPGAFAAFEPLLRFIAMCARRKGIDRKLEAAYCR